MMSTQSMRVPRHRSPTPTAQAAAPTSCRLAQFVVEGCATFGVALYPAAGWPLAAPAGTEPFATRVGVSHSWMPRLREGLRALVARMRRASEIRRGRRAMEELDDRILRDIGVDRRWIRYAASLGRVRD